MQVILKKSVWNKIMYFMDYPGCNIVETVKDIKYDDSNK